MAFAIYPDEATAALLGKPAQTPLQLAAGEAMVRFAPLAPIVGPDLSGDNQPTSFLRIALSGLPVQTQAQPRIELRASNDGAVTLADPNTAITASTAAILTDADGTAIAAAHFEPPYTDNVYLLKIAIKRPNTRLQLKIVNTTGAPRDMVWIVADNVEDTLQPWLHATFRNVAPIDISFETRAGEAATADPIFLTNFGTGPLKVTDVTPHVTPPFTLSGLPVILGPNPQTRVPVTLGFQAPAIPGDIRATSATFVTANRYDPGPFGPGHNNSFSFRARILSADRWTTKAPMAARRAQFGLATGSNGRLYAMGGSGGGMGATGRTVEEYDPTTNSWSPKAHLPRGQPKLRLVAAGNGKLYAVSKTMMAEYDPATNNWVSRTPLANNRQHFALAIGANGRIYVIGGVGNAIVATVNEYNPVTDTWRRRAPLPVARGWLAAAGASDGKIYAVGGGTDNSSGVLPPVATVEAYDPATDRWEIKEPMQTARFNLGLAAASNGRLYAVGGNVGPFAFTAMVEEYDPATDRWSTKAPMLTARANLGVAATRDGRLYAVGGRGPATGSSGIAGPTFDIVEEYTP